MTDLTTIDDRPPAATGKTEPKPAKITAKVRAAISIMVWEGLKRADAAAKAGLKDNSLYVALRKPDVRALYVSECETLRLSGRARRIHRLDQLAEQDENRNAAVAAIKAAEGLNDHPGTNVSVNVGIAVAGWVVDLSEPGETGVPRAMTAPAKTLPRVDPIFGVQLDQADDHRVG